MIRALLFRVLNRAPDCGKLKVQTNSFTLKHMTLRENRSAFEQNLEISSCLSFLSDSLTYRQAHFDLASLCVYSGSEENGMLQVSVPPLISGRKPRSFCPTHMQYVQASRHGATCKTPPAAVMPEGPHAPRSWNPPSSARTAKAGH